MVLERENKALEFLQAWSTWMITVETTLLTVAGATVLFKDKVRFCHGWFVTCIVCFALSIAAAAWVLGSLPSIRLRIQDGQTPYSLRIFDLPWMPALNVFVFVQHAAFLAGLVALLFLLATAKAGGPLCCS